MIFHYLDCSSPFCFSLIEFLHCSFLIFYKIILYYVYYYCILIRYSGRPSGLRFFPYSRLSSYLLRLFLYLISFLLFPCSSVWENTSA